MNKIFAKRLKQMMEFRKISVQQLADKISVTRSSVYTWLDGKYLPSLEVFITIADVLEVNALWLIGKSDVQYYFTTEPEVSSIWDSYRTLSDEDKSRVAALISALEAATKVEWDVKNGD